MSLSRHLAALVAGFMMVSPLRADDGLAPADKAIRAAIVKAVPALEKGAAGSAKERKCFTCHNQALPVLALVGARKRGFSIDKENLEKQLRHTETHLKRGRRGISKVEAKGKVITAGYALWALQAGGPETERIDGRRDPLPAGVPENEGPLEPPRQTATVLRKRLHHHVRCPTGTGRIRNRKAEGPDRRTNQGRAGVVAWQKSKRHRSPGVSPASLKYVEPDGNAMTKATARLVDSPRKDGGFGHRQRR
ncbi:MAG: hypothetical protein CM1200mP2_12530 [Planctomycetaceae bacterium]|nr:MAG: hypothetical protein CM1200mP2_12530 [Planctomycetaceae bacterium]